MSRVAGTHWGLFAWMAAIAVVSLAASSAYANGPAGIVLYYRHGNSVFLLLADHAQSKRGWSAFGGAAGMPSRTRPRSSSPINGRTTY